MSSDLQWLLVRQHNSFIVKRDGITLSAEPGNLTNEHSYKFSGLANKKVVHVGADKNKKVSLIVRRTRSGARHPATNRLVVPLNKHRRGGRIRAASTIQTYTSKSHYRPDLTQFAVARYHALRAAAQRKEGTGVNTTRRRTPAAQKKKQK